MQRWIDITGSRSHYQSFQWRHAKRGVNTDPTLYSVHGAAVAEMDGDQVARRERFTQEAGALTGDETMRGAVKAIACLLYTSPSPRDGLLSRMPSSA